MEHPQRYPEHNQPDKNTPSNGDMVCITLQRPPHFWRFACAPGETGELLERLANMADDPNTALTWQDAELIASEVVVHHHLDNPSAG